MERKRYRHTSFFYRKLKNRILLNEKTLQPSENIHPSSPQQDADSQNIQSSSSHEADSQNIQPSSSPQEANSQNVQSSSSQEAEVQNIQPSTSRQQSDMQNILASDTEDDMVSHQMSNSDDDELSDSNIAKLDDFNISFKYKIQQWALHYQIRHNALNGLLGILRDVPNMDSLPKDSRVLLETPKTNDIVDMGSGKYWYNGLHGCIKQICSQSRVQLPTKLTLTFNIDGLPIPKSSKDQFWPILCKISEIDVSPLVVAIYHGSAKPPVNDFLRTFVDEVLNLLQDGIVIENRVINVQIRCFVCDTPARCLVKGTMGFNSYHGCMKCIIIGEYDRNCRHMSFPRTDLPLRTNSSFRNRLDPDHHKERTIIEELPIDLVNDFPIADALHLLDLGVMKRCLVGWTSGSFNFKTKWSAREIQAISIKLTEIKSYTPNEIHQGRLRDLDSIHFWKGTEFKNFLLDYGPVILKDFLSFEVYQHFLTLFCATTICYNDAYQSYRHIAQQLFEDYIEKFAEIYGRDSISSNIHNLCHIVNDVSRFGSLPSLSAYPFESMLFKIKNLLRKGSQPLSQVANRLQELSKLNLSDLKKSELYPVVKYEKELTTGETVFATVKLSQNYLLSSKNHKDKWFLNQNNQIIEMEYAIMSQEEIKIRGKCIKNTFNFFEKPFKSSYINVYATSINYETGESTIYTLQSVKCKLLSVVYQQNMIFIPILSTL